MSRFFTALFLCGFFFSASSQLPWCASAEVHRQMLNGNPAIAERFEQLQQQFRQYASRGKKAGTRAVVTIPVVVHVVHDGDSIGAGENISDEQVRSQIDVLNRDYRNLNPNTMSVPSPFQPLVADFEIEFCLAALDPHGYPTTGIERINAGRPAWNIALADQLKPSTIWNPDRYLNIWVMRLGGTSSNTLGYAQFPWMPDSTDGIVIDYKAFGTIGDLLPDHHDGKTATHEVGHWLGLFHTWGDDGGDCSMDDNVMDTPRQASENYGCPSFPHISCSNGPNGDMFMNYMDYVDDDCSSMFTHGQKTLVDFYFTTERQSILSSQACIPTTVNSHDMAVTGLIFPTEEICTDNFTPVVQVRNLGSATITSLLVNYQLDGVGLEQFAWSGYIPTYSFDYIFLPAQTMPLGAHSIYIYLSAPNGASDQNVGNENVSLNFTINSIGIGNPLPADEGFESGALPPSWLTQNPDGDRTWKIDTTTGSGGSSMSAKFDNFSGTASSNPRGTRDGLITPEYDFRFANIPNITFQVAYARRTANSKDSLLLYYSLDCGYSWMRIWAKGAAALATTADKATTFIPQADEWREELVWVNLLSGQSKVQFKFENYSDWGNNIYVDEFKLNLTPEGIPDTIDSKNMLHVFPSPNDGNFSVAVKTKTMDDFKIEVYNFSGQKIQEIAVTQTNNWNGKINLTGYSRGLYLIRVVSEDTISYRKVFAGK
ncbi:MAG TPA: M43 family zinc metalloprotease [Chitinophagales bacterium]|nr:M43 family zinc metalloprotease [Chitinophagales bacterium]